MTTSPVRLERRAGQRFPYLLPLSVHQPSTSAEGVGFTQDLSSRGVFFFTDAPLTEGADIELTLRMPSEITLGENMPVRCHGRILRIVRPASHACNFIAVQPELQAETKIGVAVRFDHYECLPDTASSNLSRISSLHPHHDDDQPVLHSSLRP